MKIKDLLKLMPRGIVADETGVLMRFTNKQVFHAMAQYPDFDAATQGMLCAYTYAMPGSKLYHCASITELIHAVRVYRQEFGNGYNGKLWSAVLASEGLNPELLLRDDADTLATVNSWFEEPKAEAAPEMKVA